MRSVFVPAMLALAVTVGASSDASAFGHLSKLFGHNACDACCDVQPACGCEVAVPTCGCEVVDPCCGAPKLGLFHKLFHKHNACCDMGCAPEPTCGCEIPAPACGCEVAAPACGCEAPCGHRHKIGGFLKKLFHKHECGCDSGCVIAEPACGIEPSCGCGF